MHPDKAEFKRLIGIMGWSQTEAARQLHKTPSAINHLVNPKHPNKPDQTTLELLKLIIDREQPDLMNAQTRELKEATTGAKFNTRRFSPREWKMVEGLRRLPAAEQVKVYAMIMALLRISGHEGLEYGANDNQASIH